MQAQFNAGDRVKVYGDAFSAASPERVSGTPREATIVRQMPYDEPPHYELDDGTIAQEDVLRPATKSGRGTPSSMYSPPCLSGSRRGTCPHDGRRRAAAAEEHPHAPRLSAALVSPVCGRRAAVPGAAGSRGLPAQGRRKRPGMLTGRRERDTSVAVRLPPLVTAHRSWGVCQGFADDASSRTGATGLRHCRDATHQNHEEAHLHHEEPEAKRGRAGRKAALGSDQLRRG
jgi:hypothetical protein